MKQTLEEIKEIATCSVRTDEQKMADIDEVMGITKRYCEECCDEFTLED